MIWAKKHKGIVFLAITILLFLLYKLVPELANIYHYTFFALWRIVWDSTLANIPFILFPFTLVLLAFTLWKWRKQWVNVISIWIASFFWLWGFHYALPPLFPLDEKQKEVSPEVLYKATCMAADSTNFYLQDACEALKYTSLTKHHLQKEAVEMQLTKTGLKPFGEPNVRSTMDFDVLRKIGIGGIYMPYALEGYFDGTFLPERQVFVMHHELCHAYGVTDEGECDYLAFCALQNADKANSMSYKVAKYVSWLELYISLRSELLMHFPDAKSRIDGYQEPLLAAKMEELRADAKAHLPWFPGAAENMNHGYLSAMGVQGGIKSYDRLVTLYIQENWQLFETKPDSVRGHN
jgi:hypothetical protein